MQTSVDGFVGRAGEGPGRQVWDRGPKCPWDDRLKARFNPTFQQVDAILLSRKILEGGYLDHLSWQEHNGSTIAHTLDCRSATAYTAVTPAKGGFMRLVGRIRVEE